MINEKFVNLDKQISFCLLMNEESLDASLEKLQKISDDEPTDSAIALAESLFNQWVNAYRVKKELCLASQSINDLSFELNKDSDISEMVATELWEAMKLEFDKSSIDDIKVYNPRLVDIVTSFNETPEITPVLAIQGAMIIREAFLYAINWLECKR